MTASASAPDSSLVAVSHSRRWLPLAGLVLLLFYRWAVIRFAGVPLFYDEAQYYGWALQPDFGYYSKPPMVAWLIYLSTRLFGHAEAAVRLASPLLYVLAALVAFGIGWRLFNRQVGVVAALVVATMPGVGVSSLAITTDAPLLFFWALTAYLFLRGRDSQGWGWWLLAGVSCGLGLLSKYTFVVLPASLILYLAGSGEHRRRLADRRFWGAAAVALLVFSPNICWNYRHQFATLAHTATISRLGGPQPLLQPGKLLEFLGGQFGVLGPLLAALLIVRLAQLARRRQLQSLMSEDGLWFCLALTVPLLALISMQALLSRAFINWAMPAFLGGALLTAALLLRAGWRRWLLAGIVFNLAVTGVLYHYHALAAAAGIELSGKTDPYYRMLGWPEAAKAVRPFIERHPDALVASDTRKVLANLIYYGRVPPQRLALWNPRGRVDNHYALTADMGRHVGRSFIFVSESPLPEALRQRVAGSRYLTEVVVPVYADLERRLYVYYLQDFGGYR